MDESFLGHIHSISQKQYFEESDPLEVVREIKIEKVEYH